MDPSPQSRTKRLTAAKPLRFPKIDGKWGGVSGYSKTSFQTLRHVPQTGTGGGIHLGGFIPPRRIAKSHTTNQNKDCEKTLLIAVIIVVLSKLNDEIDLS